MTWRPRMQVLFGVVLLLAVLGNPHVFAAGDPGTGFGDLRWEGDPRAAWHRVELGWVRGFQGDGKLGTVMRWVSALGPGPVMAGWMGLLVLGGRPRFGVRLAVVVLSALWFREVLALGLQSPRPYWLDPGLQTFGDVATQRATYGLPSGHAWVGAAFWFYFAAEVGRRWAWWVATGVTVAIAASRVYLGVHFVSDVVLGLGLGIGHALLFRRWDGPLRRYLDRREGEAGGAPQTRGIAAAGVWVGLGMFGIGLAVRAWVDVAPLPEGWAGAAAGARRGGVFALLGGSFLGLTMGILRWGPQGFDRLERGRLGSLGWMGVGVAGAGAYALWRTLRSSLGLGWGLGMEHGVGWVVVFVLAAVAAVAGCWGLPRALGREGAKRNL